MLSTVKYILGLLFINSCRCQLPEWNIPCDAVYKPKNCENADYLSLQTVEDFERCAPARLNIYARNYFWCGSGKEITMRENKAAYQRIRLIPRVLRDVSNSTLVTTVLGKKMKFPIGISPTAMHDFAHPDGELATARAATSMGTIMILSMFSSKDLEDVMAEVPTHSRLWMHAEFLKDTDSLRQTISRAEKAGFEAIVLTVDNKPISSECRCNARSSIIKRVAKKKIKFPNLLKDDDYEHCVTFTFKDVAAITKSTKLPIIVKGILSGEDAKHAVEAGVSAIYVSNHGGREVDGSPPTIDVIAEVVDAVRSVKPSVEVYVDGGIRSGSDVFKAFARGANAVFVGRPILWGLTIGGEKGVRKVLKILKSEFYETMIHSGYSSPNEIPRSSVIPPVPSPYCS